VLADSSVEISSYGIGPVTWPTAAPPTRHPLSNEYPIPHRIEGLGCWAARRSLLSSKKPVAAARGRPRCWWRGRCGSRSARTDIEIIRHGVPAMIDGELPFNRGFTPGHEYMGTIVKLGPTVDEFSGRRPRHGRGALPGVAAVCAAARGMYTSCLNYGYRAKGHRANGFSTDGGFAEYAVNQHQYPRSYPGTR